MPFLRQELSHLGRRSLLRRCPSTVLGDLSHSTRDQMLRLPDSLQVQLCDARGLPVREADVLVAINLLVAERYYYGSLVGLTDSNGSACISREEIERRYYQDRARFPMDYKVELLDCDAFIEVVLLGREDVAVASAAVADDFSVAEYIREQYARARNAEFSPALLRAIGDRRDLITLVLTLPALSYR